MLQPTKQGAASLTNAFVAALSAYAQLQLTNDHRSKVAAQEAYISGLEKAISELPKKQKKKTTTPSTTTTTHAPVKVKKVVVKTKKKTKKAERVRTGGTGATDPRADAPSAATTTALAGRGAPRIELVDTAATTTTLAPGATETTLEPGTTETTLAAPGGTALTTLPPSVGTGSNAGALSTAGLNAKTIKEENRVLSGELAHALAQLVKLTSTPATTTGIRVISVASPKGAVKLNPNPPLLSNAFIRALLGLVIGVLLGVIATWTLDAFDRRLRTSKRAEDVFGLPVIVEVPRRTRRRCRPSPSST